MNKDQIKGRTQEVTGKTKEVAGKVLHNDSLKNRGAAEEVAGKARAIYGDAKSEAKKEIKKD
jgi:uncharacterized protein YjbJ (UPF0337 family)